ncbi:aldehyde dehydrogenase (NADP(+)) [Spiribacter vilamensis]|uniref:2,5-dioxovalerate dehydrogenase n=1 Tax=Spiribacter vilamensis TaxID=531306 RepID=A0A4Q8D1X1_9GAMM|nr:aldehyde dehydrogenase (NADP(+)) [Spiribacter vilamensis]RZU99359.1 2,5-dioxopentanoate dehydrogenase [Spiribacter vilamensis]TVO61659.1 aldehyde dehydrogenase (NADP(+)) [Spiribacter vilamensis]
MTLTTDQFIAGARRAAGHATFQAEDAASGERLAPAFVEATPEEIDAACQAAAAAADRFADAPLATRAGLLEAIAEGLEARADAFVERAGAETGLPEPRIRGELARTTGQLRMFARVVREGGFLGVRIDHGDPDRQPAPKPDLRQRNIPLGPVAVFGASNFPLAFSVCGGDTASALAAGCPVVVKAHPAHPGTSALAAEAVEAAVADSDLPAGVFSMLQGAGHDLGAALVRHPAIEAVGFTGSQRGGLALQRIAAERDRPIPVHAEMGSVNPLFVLPGALADRPEAIARGLAGSVALGCGQFCTKPGLVFVRRGEGFETFREQLIQAVEAMAPAIMLHSGILAAFEAGCERLAAAEGVERLAAGDSAEHRARATAFITAAEILNAQPDLADEVFGPAVLVVTLDDATGFETVAEGLVGQLTAGIHARDSELDDQAALITRLEQRAGRVLFNGFPTGVEVGEAMVHGGPYPSTTDSRTTSVGTRAIERFLRPVALQDMPPAALPPTLRDDNPLGLPRRVDGVDQPGAAH